MNVPIQYYIYLGFIVFSVGIVGVLTRRNVIGILMSIELMLNGSNLVLVSFSRIHGDTLGIIFVIFTITITVAEVAIGLALVIQAFRLKMTVNADEVNLLKG